MQTPAQIRFNNRSKNFRAEIARRAAMLQPPVVKTYSIPNTPYGVPKVARPPLPKIVFVVSNPEEDGWYREICLEPEQPQVSRWPAISAIKQVVADEYNIDLKCLNSPLRIARIARARQIAMWLCRHLTIHSLPVIAKHFGGRDHTTVLHAVRKFDELYRTDPLIAGELAAVAKKLDGRL